MITAISIAPTSTPAPTLPPADLTIELYRAELSRDLALIAEFNGESDSKLRREIASSNSRRSHLIMARTAIRKWTENEAPAILKGDVHIKMIGGKEVVDPYVKLSKDLNLDSRFFQIPSAIKAPKVKGVTEAQTAASNIQARFRKLREVSCMDWHFKLEWITDMTLRIRIAKLIWWDMANTLKNQNCVLTELVNAPITTAQVMAYTEEQVAFELWRLGWPATMAADRAFHAQKPQK